MADIQENPTPAKAARQRPRSRTRPLYAVLPAYESSASTPSYVQRRRTPGWVLPVVLFVSLLAFLIGLYLGGVAGQSAPGSAGEGRPLPNTAATEAVLRQWVSASVAATLTAVAKQAPPDAVAAGDARPSQTPMPSATTAIAPEAALPETIGITNTLVLSQTAQSVAGGSVAAATNHLTATTTLTPTATLASISPVASPVRPLETPVPKASEAIPTPLAGFDIVPRAIGSDVPGLVEYTARVITLTYQLSTTADIAERLHGIHVHPQYLFVDRKQRGVVPQISFGPYSANQTIRLSVPFPSSVPRESIGPAQVSFEFTPITVEGSEFSPLRRELGFTLCSTFQAQRKLSYSPVGLDDPSSSVSNSSGNVIERNTPVCLIGRVVCEGVTSPLIKLAVADSEGADIQFGWAYLWEELSTRARSYAFLDEDVASLPLVDSEDISACASNIP